MKRILVVGMSSILGGVEKEVLSLIKYAPKDYKFDFLCFGKAFSYEKDNPNIEFYYIPRRKDNYRESQKKQKAFWLRNGNNYDWIWINTSSASNLSMHRFARKYSKAQIITHSHGSKIEHNNGLLRLAHEILHFLNRRQLVSHSNVLVACSENAARHLFGREAQNAFVIYNGIEVEKFKYSKEIGSLKRNEIGIAKNEIVLLCVGRLECVKNFIYAIKVYNEIHKIDSNYRLLIVGDGSQKKMLNDYAIANKISNISFVGYTPDVKPFYDASDILLQPSLFEGFPVSTIEAQANGLYCVLSDKITSEVAKTSNVIFHGIGNSNINEWVESILRMNGGIDREKANNEIQEAGFNVKESASKFFNILVSRRMRIYNE